MTLKLYNTLTRKKETFQPLDTDNVRMYVCGPTVYDYAHIGNARPVIVFDVLFRLLRYLAAKGEWDGGKGQTKVTYVRNITDVDDKINARAAEEGIDIRDLTEQTAKQFHEDVAALGCLAPTVEPRATEHIADMIAMIEQLIALGFAYEAEGHVLFEVAKMADYGKLSGRSLDEMEAGARVEVAPYKKDPMDFVLWKPSEKSHPGWDSPWGRGRPGWHIECSAMSNKHLKTPFDIHGGGVDLVFPHHENEVAQSRCCFGADKMAAVWMHNGYLQVEGEKMSKSLGNFVTVHELLQTEKFGGRKWSGEVIRLAMLMTHYRQPIDWTVRGLEAAESILNRWFVQFFSDTVNDYGFPLPDGDGFGEPFGLGDGDGYGGGDANLSTFIEALEDDLNTHLALMILHQIDEPSQFRQAFKLLGLDLEVFAEWKKSLAASLDTEQVDRLISARNEAREAKDFAEADRIRDELAEMGITLKDGPDGTTWEVAR